MQNKDSQIDKKKKEKEVTVKLNSPLYKVMFTYTSFFVFENI